MKMKSKKTKNPIITLTTDFGYSYNYAGAVKAVVLSINPHARIVDISHDIPPFDIVSGAFALGTTYNYFPKGTIHMAVVDPGVGGFRKPILVETEDYYFVGPDNGIFSLIEQKSEVLHIYELNQKQYFLEHVSSTFHGRDVFAPVAAHLSKGVSADKMGMPVKTFEILEAFEVEIHDDHIAGQVLMIDGFGNVITNIDNGVFTKTLNGRSFTIHVKDELIQNIYRTYSDAPLLSKIALFGSSGFLELAISQGAFVNSVPVRVGDEILIEIGH